MRSFILLTVCLFCCTLNVAAQKGQPAFGKISAIDLLMTDCDFDKGADALVLIDYGSTYYDRGIVGVSLFTTVFERRTRIKILKEKGLSQANVEIPYCAYLDEEKVINLQARTYNIDDKGRIQTTEVTKTSIYTKKIDANYSKKIIAFPEVKAGSVIEYRYRLERRTEANLRNWNFQGNIPVLYSEYQLKIPQIFRFTVKKSVIDVLEERKEVIGELLRSGEEIVATKSIKNNYIMRKLQGIREEPFMGSAKDYMQRIEFQLTQVYYNNTKIVDIGLKWKDVIEDLMDHENFGLALLQKITATDTLIEKANKIADAEKRMKFIFNSIRNAVKWNGEYHIFTDKGILKTWDTKSGNSADLNLLLIKLLKDASIQAKPVLFSTRNNGLVMPHYPFTDQFNTVLAYVSIAGKNYILDATDKIAAYNLIPYKVVNTKGFLPEGENGSWIDASPGKNKYKITAAVRGGIEENGVMKGTAQVSFYDYARVQSLEDRQHDSQKFKYDYFIQPYRALTIEDITVNNLLTDSLAFEQKIKFSSNVNGSGAYRYFNINLFLGIAENPFVEEYRLSDIDFAVQQEYLLFGNYTIPEGFSFDGVPENIVLTTSDKSIVFNRSVQVESNLLNVRITIEFKKSFYTAGFYPELREFYKKLFEKLNEQVVIKQVKTPAN